MFPDLPPRYPDPAIEILDPSFLKYRLFNASVERLATGTRWGEGPVWFGDGRYLLWSDIPNNRIMRWDETTGQASVFRAPSNHANGNTRDRQGRLVTCEHGAPEMRRPLGRFRYASQRPCRKHRRPALEFFPFDRLPYRRKQALFEKSGAKTFVMLGLRR